MRVPEVTFQAMNTGFLLAGIPETLCSKIQELINRAETYFSRFDRHSQINQINSNQGQWIAVSPITFELLQHADEAYWATDGLFNPFLGAAMQKYGYNKSFEHLKAVNDYFGIAYQQLDTCYPTAISAQQSELPGYLELDSIGYRVRLSPAVTLDLGGIAKGWCAQFAFEYCISREVNDGLIDAGGDIMLWGNDHKQKLWGVGVAHPLEPDKDIADLWLEGLVGIATSSTVKRRWMIHNQRVAHHLIDPRTQSPASSDLIQVTVCARNLVVAEQYAKCLLILGSEAGIPWMKAKRPDLAYIAIRLDGRVYSENLHLFCEEWEVKHNL